MQQDSLFDIPFLPFNNDMFRPHLMNIKQDIFTLLSPDFRTCWRIFGNSSSIRRREKRHPPMNRTDFYWEHTLHAAAFVSKICRFEEIDPLVPVLTTLFHDAGKFAEGHVHADDLPGGGRSRRHRRIFPSKSKSGRTASAFRYRCSQGALP